ncbi:MAG: hypothetical protein WAT71_17990 [Ignavibacteria bacterium]
MAKKNISKILTQGSQRQRVTLLSTNTAHALMGKGEILTNQERDELFNSFKTPQEINFYNKYAKVNRNIYYVIPLLLEKKLQYEGAIASLNGLIISWEDYQQTEETFNFILYNIPEKKLKNKIKKIILNRSYIYAYLKEDKEGFIKFDMNSEDKEHTFEVLVKAYNNKATNILRQGKAYIKAIRDYLIEEDLYIQGYKDLINSYEKPLQESKALISKYSKKEVSKILREDKKTIELLEKYFVFPDYDELVINEKDYREIREAMQK